MSYSTMCQASPYSEPEEENLDLEIQADLDALILEDEAEQEDNLLEDQEEIELENEVLISE